MNRVDAAIAIVRRAGKILICQRKDDDTLGGYWEFPGGKIEDGETPEQCLHRELREEVALVIRPLVPLEPIEHAYPSIIIRLLPYLCDHISGEPQHLECQASKWIDPPELLDHQFPPANEKLLLEVIERFKRQD